MTAVDQVKLPVVKMYMAHPYPNYSTTERRQIFAAELCRYRYPVLARRDCLRLLFWN